MPEVHENEALEACSTGNLSTLKGLLLSDGTFPRDSASTKLDTRCHTSRTDDQFHPNPLLISQMLERAAQNSHTNIVQFILDEYPKTELYESSVRRAAQGGSIELYKVLLSHDPTVIDMDFYDGREFPITVALNIDTSPEFIGFLLSAGADPNVGAFGVDCLALATRSRVNSLKLCAMLIESGADVKKSCALSVAARQGRLDVVRYLLQQGADVNNLSNGRARDVLDLSHNWPPLHTAIEEGYLNVCVLLLDHGADPYTLDKHGRTALQVARASEIQEIARMLQARGIVEHREGEPA